MVFFIFIQFLIEHSESRQWRLIWVSTVCLTLSHKKRTLSLYGLILDVKAACKISQHEKSKPLSCCTLTAFIAYIKLNEGLLQTARQAWQGRDRQTDTHTHRFCHRSSQPSGGPNHITTYCLCIDQFGAF